MTIAVIFTAMVAVLFSTLSGCRGCTSEEEVVRWIPAARDTIPDTIVEDSLLVDLVEEEMAVTSAPVKERLSIPKQRNTYSEDVYQERTYGYYNDRNTRSWADEFDLDSIKLTIIVADLEMQITQSSN